MIEQTLSRLIDKVENSYYGKYKGFVVDNDDPENLGRLKVKVPSILGEDVVTGWAMPCLPYGGANDQGFFFIPEIDAGVWVEFEEGNLEYPVWAGTFWSKPAGASEAPKPGDAQSPPTRKIIRTVKGNSIELEDKDNEETLIIIEKTNNNKVTMDKNGIIFEDGSGNKIILDKNGIIIEDKNQNKIQMDGTSGFPAGKNIVLNGNKRICLDGLIDWLMSHKHIGNMGAPCPLSPDDMSKLVMSKASPNSGILSDNVTAK